MLIALSVSLSLSSTRFHFLDSNIRAIYNIIYLPVALYKKIVEFLDRMDEKGWRSVGRWDGWGTFP